MFEKKVEDKVVRVPTEWGMFNSRGNKRITQLAQRAHDKMEKLQGGDRYWTPREVRKVLVSYLVSWLRLGYTKTYSEAGDTAVRESVGSFHDVLWEAMVGDGNVYDVWEENLEEAYKIFRKRRNK